MKKDLLKIADGISTLTIFSGLKSDPVVSAFSRLFEESDLRHRLDSYSTAVNRLFEKNEDLAKYLFDAVSQDENVFVRRMALGLPVSENMQNSIDNELKILQQLSLVTPSDIAEFLEYDGFLPEYSSSELDFPALYADRIDHIGTHGYGIFAGHNIFTLNEGALIPVRHPDEITLSRLIGYRKQRQTVVDNTVALLEGRHALNLLLYGDAGTGKSSTVKAIANEFQDKGLRLIELKKSQLRDIPAVVETIGKNPLKFIIFIDDLSFNENDDDFAALKAALEGSVSALSENTVIYATSNRRHLIKEDIESRSGSELHENDTIQELVSLSERFGLTVSFMKPNKQEYTEIVLGLAKLHGLSVPEDRLILEAERFALRHAGRSARTAKQFIDYAISVDMK